MSGSETFNAPDVPTLDRIDHLESVLPLLVRLSEYNTVKDYVASMADILKEHGEAILALKPALVIVKEKITDIHSSLQMDTANLKDDHSLIQSRVNSLGSLLNKNADDTSKVAQSVEEAKVGLVGLQKQLGSLASSDSVKYLSDELKTFKDKAESAISESKSPILQVFSLIEDVKKTQSDLAETLNSHEKKHSELKDLIQELSQSILDTKKYLESQTVGMIAVLKEDIGQRFASIPQVVTPPSMAEIKKLCCDLLEPVSLDAKNASLRSNNSDMKMSLLEKKLEQVTLLAKRFELTQ